MPEQSFSAAAATKGERRRAGTVFLPHPLRRPVRRSAHDKSGFIMGVPRIDRSGRLCRPVRQQGVYPSHAYSCGTERPVVRDALSATRFGCPWLASHPPRGYSLGPQALRGADVTQPGSTLGRSARIGPELPVRRVARPRSGPARRDSGLRAWSAGCVEPAVPVRRVYPLPGGCGLLPDRQEPAERHSSSQRADSRSVAAPATRSRSCRRSSSRAVARSVRSNRTDDPGRS
jgi:hypothetical protein